MYAVMVYFTVINMFSSSQLADPRYPSLLACERAKSSVAKAVQQVANSAAAQAGMHVEITRVQCVRQS